MKAATKNLSVPGYERLVLDQLFFRKIGMCYNASQGKDCNCELEKIEDRHSVELNARYNGKAMGDKGEDAAAEGR